MSSPSPSNCSARALSAAIRKAATLARKHREAIDAMAPLLMQRYGMIPNDVDCDSFIDSTDYGHGGMTVKELDAAMADRGYPPNALRQARAAQGVDDSTG